MNRGTKANARGIKKKKNSKMAVLCPRTLIIAIHMNGLNNPVKGRDCQTGKNTQDSTLCYLLGLHFRFRDTNRLKIKHKELSGKWQL